METVIDTERSAVLGTGKEEIRNRRFGMGAAVLYPEPFVDVEVVADFLSMKRAGVLKLARERKIRSYPYGGKERHVYRFRLSEVSEDFEKLARDTIPAATPVSQRRKTSNG